MAGDGELAQRAWDRAEGHYAHQVDAATEAGRTAVYAALFLNGGASVVLLWFLSGAVSAQEMSLDRLNDIEGILRSTRWFAIGAFLAACASGVGYLFNHLRAESFYRAQYVPAYPYVEETRASIWLRRTGLALLAVSIGLVAASLALFLVSLSAVLRHF